jgi:FAD/FMN-containing dehydrogenase
MLGGTRLLYGRVTSVANGGRLVTLVEEGNVSWEGFSGELLGLGDAGYDQARQVHNGMIDKHPALIARCRGVADVVAAVHYARDIDAEVSIRGGGHNVAGRAVTDGGVMIDLSLMRGIHVDPAARSVQAQGGVTWAELNRETQVHGLAVTGGTVSTTGIAGLTLGGGLGWLMGQHGLAADNLLSAEVVTASGDVLTASGSEHPDLLWALRGGGGNFGVVSSFEFRLHPVGPIVTGGLAIHPFDDAAAVLRCFRELAASAPDELGVIGALIHSPDGAGTKLAAVVVCHAGGEDRAQADLAGLLAFGSPLDVQIGPMPYCAVNMMLDAGFPKGALSYWKSSFLRELSDAAIDTAVAQFAASPSPMSAIVLEHLHGAVTRVPADATAVPHRSEGYNFLAVGEWMDPATTDANVAWARDAYAAMQPFTGEQLRYVSYLDEDDIAEDAARSAYGSNLDRLVQVKRTYDPENLFRMNANIVPAGR